MFGGTYLHHGAFINDGCSMGNTGHGDFAERFLSLRAVAWNQPSSANADSFAEIESEV